MKTISNTRDIPPDLAGRQLEDGHTLSGDDIQKASTLPLTDYWQRRPKSRSQRLAKVCIRTLLACIPGGEEPLREGMKRVRWICFCYRRHYDDYYEARPGVAKDIQEELNTTYGEPMRQYELFIRECRRRLSIWTPFWMQSERHRLARLMFQLAVPTAAVVLAKLFRSVDPTFAISLAVYGVVLLTSITVSLGTLLMLMTAEESSSERGGSGGARSLDDVDSDAPTACDPQWILALFKDNIGDLRYVHLSAKKRNTDFALFRGLKGEYNRLSRCCRFKFLRQVSAIRFVRFNVTDEKRGHVIARNVWPPEHDPRVWIYEPYPVDTVPLVGRQVVMSLWRDAHHTDAAAYEECRRSATWHRRAKFSQVIRDIFALDDDDKDTSIFDPNLPSKLQAYRRDIERPEEQPRSKHVLTRVPKLNTRKLESEAWGLEVEEFSCPPTIVLYPAFLHCWKHCFCNLTLPQAWNGSQQVRYPYRRNDHMAPDLCWVSCTFLD